MPKRIVWRRARGARLPANTVLVTRPSKFGNPYRVDSSRTQETCVRKYREHLEAAICAERNRWTFGPYGIYWLTIVQRLPTLRGKDLACYCRLDQPCHADVLLELANRPEKGAESDR